MRLLTLSGDESAVFNPALSFGGEVNVSCFYTPITNPVGFSGPEFGYLRLFYSYLNATIGSTFAARRAGHQAANRPIIRSTATADTNVIGSCGVTPNSKLRSSRAPTTET